MAAKGRRQRRITEGDGMGPTPEETALFNAAMQAERQGAAEGLLNWRSGQTTFEQMRNLPSLTGGGAKLSPEQVVSRQAAAAKAEEKRLKDLEKQQAAALANAGRAAQQAFEREKRQWERQDRAWTLADRATQQRLAEEERQRQAAAQARQGAAYRSIADLYRTQGQEAYQAALQNIGSIYGGEESAVNAARQRQLDALMRAMGESRGQIGAAEQQALSSLVAPTAYQNVPLVNLAPQQQVLQAALAAEGAGPSQQQVAEQNYAQQLAAQFNELARRSAEQLNVGEQNYLTALRNALTGGALAARTGVEQRGTAIRGGVEEQYATAVRELARQRAAEQAQADAERRAAMLRAAEAAAQAEAFSPAPAAAGAGTGAGTGGGFNETATLTPQQLEDLRRRLELAALAANPQQAAQPTLGMFGMQ